MVGNTFAAFYPMPSLGTLHLSVLFQGLPAPAIATNKLSPSLGMATKQVRISRQGHLARPCHWAQPHSTFLSPGTTTWQVPIAEHDHTSGPH